MFNSRNLHFKYFRFVLLHYFQVLKYKTIPTVSQNFLLQFSKMNSVRGHYIIQSFY